jgi:hypothetical protein
MYTEPMKKRSTTHINYLTKNVSKKPSEKLGILFIEKKIAIILFSVIP